MGKKQKGKRGRPATGRDPVLTVRVPKQVLDALDRAAARKRVRKATLIRAVLRASVHRKRKDKTK